MCLCLSVFNSFISLTKLSVELFDRFALATHFMANDRFVSYDFTVNFNQIWWIFFVHNSSTHETHLLYALLDELSNSFRCQWFPAIHNHSALASTYFCNYHIENEKIFEEVFKMKFTTVTKTLNRLGELCFDLFCFGHHNSQWHFNIWHTGIPTLPIRCEYVYVHTYKAKKMRTNIKT